MFKRIHFPESNHANRQTHVIPAEPQCGAADQRSAPGGETVLRAAGFVIPRHGAGLRLKEGEGGKKHFRACRMQLTAIEAWTRR